MDLKQLEYIAAIEKYGNITSAAEHVFVTPSALTQQLLRLESNLGTQLFIRNRHKMIPTKEGTIYLNGVHQILRIKQETYDEIQQASEKATYHIGLTSGFSLTGNMTNDFICTVCTAVVHCFFSMYRNRTPSTLSGN